MVRVLVVGAGLGTNAGLGLEVPLAHGKLVTDGRGGFREISAEASQGHGTSRSISFRTAFQDFSS